MQILVVGGGGREHALIWKIAQNPSIKKIYCAPGNGGIGQLAECVDINAENIPKLASFAQAKKIDLTVVGPEIPLVRGIVDEFQKYGLKIFGPTKKAANIEGSKVFAKKLIEKYNIPTAKGKIFTHPAEAKDYIKNANSRQCVVKADGLAAGKAVIVCLDKNTALEAVKKMMEERIFGKAGEQIIVEELLEGEEASVIAFTDGKTILPLLPSQDHKRVHEGDKGPNTGGMGAYAPAPVLTPQMLDNVLKEILIPIVKGMKKEGILYKGVLYAGIIITAEGPKVLEFNCRFGDPENQVIMPLLKTDLIEIMEAIMEERLDKIKIKWSKKKAICVILASGGYPGKYEKGKEIKGLDKIEQIKDIMVFHGGTVFNESGFFTNGGRVLGITALGDTLPGAMESVYKAIDKIDFAGMHYRKDIGAKALKN